MIRIFVISIFIALSALANAEDSNEISEFNMPTIEEMKEYLKQDAFETMDCDTVITKHYIDLEAWLHTIKVEKEQGNPLKLTKETRKFLRNLIIGKKRVTRSAGIFSNDPYSFDFSWSRDSDLEEILTDMYFLKKAIEKYEGQKIFIHSYGYVCPSTVSVGE